MFRAVSSRALGYAIAAVIFTPLAFWAKRDAIGMWVLIVFVAIVLAAMVPYRLRNGVWPGDEHLLERSPQQRRRDNRRGWVGIACLVALCVVLAVYVQSHAR